MKHFSLLAMVMLTLSSTAYAIDADTVQIHGFISQGYLISDQNNYFFANTEEGTFEFNEIGLNFSSQLTDRLRVGLQFLSRDLGYYGNNDIDIDWAFGDYRFRNWLGFRAGLLKLALGLYNQSRDVDAARTAIFLPPSIYSESRREAQKDILGAGIYGELPGRIQYQVQFGKIDIDEDSGLAREFSGEIGVPPEMFDINTRDRAYILHLDWYAPLEGLRLGATYADQIDWDTETPLATFESEASTWLFSAEYTYDELVLAAEYRQQPLEVYLMGDKVSDLVEEQFYVMANYRFCDWFELGSYYSVFFEDKGDRDGDAYAEAGLPREHAWVKDWAVTARFDITDNWILKLEGHLFDGLLTVQSDDGDTKDDGFLFAVKTTFSF